MRDYINIGPVPAGEACVQIDDPDYHKKSIEECLRFIELLKEMCGEPPPKASLKIKDFHHDFGVYKEVVCYYDDDDPDSEDYCYFVESNTPETWEG